MRATTTAAAEPRQGRAASTRWALPRRWAWPAAFTAGAVALFFAVLRLAGTQPVKADAASNALQAWQMLHGNPLLHGWWLTDVSFYTTELPQFMLVELVAGLRPEVAHICAALTYTLLAVPAADAANRFLVAVGGFAVSKNPAKLVQPSVLPKNVPMTIRSVLSLVGADVAGARGTLNETFAFIHLAGAVLVLAALVLGGWRLVRTLGWRGPSVAADLVADMLVVAIVANIAAYFLFYQIKNVDQAHEIAPVLALGAALAGRLLGGPPLRARLVPALAAGLACYAVMLGFAASGRQAPPDNAAVAGWLEQHGLRSGIAPYWEANSVTLDSGGAITMGSVKLTGRGLSPWHWNEDMRLFRASDHTANFFITVPGEQVTPARARAAFGPPARVYHFRGYTIMVWNENLLRQLGPPVG
jgi:hypothetical protein